jgi:hypothetical protein
MRRLGLFVVMLVLCGALAGEAAGSAKGTQHAVYSHTWRGVTFVTGLSSCPVFGPIPNPIYEFDDVALTDHINSKDTPIADPLFQIDSVGTLNGAIDTPSGAFTVTGGAFKEHRVDVLDPLFFSGSGQAIISGPGGTVIGRAVFQDLADFPPPEFDLFFTTITSCHLN